MAISDTSEELLLDRIIVAQQLLDEEYGKGFASSHPEIWAVMANGIITTPMINGLRHSILATIPG